VKRPFKGREVVAQPSPEDPDSVAILANYLPSETTGLRNFLNLERETRQTFPL
jgi:hypothetical protein